MVWVKKYPFSKQGINSPNKFINNSKDSLFEVQTLGKVVLGVKGSRYVSRPILYDDEGLKSPTNLSWIRKAGNRLLKGLYSPKEMDFSCLAPDFIIKIT